MSRRRLQFLGRSVFSTLVLLGAIGIASLSQAVVVQSGDLIVADPDANEILVLDTQSGTAQTIFSGAPLQFPTGVTVALGGRLYIVDPVANSVFSLGLGQSTLTLVATGGLLEYPTGIAILGNGDLLVADPDVNQLIRINPETGTQTSETDLSALGFLYPTDIAVDSNGDFRVADPDANGIYFVDVAMGTVSPRSEGGLFEYPSGVTIDQSDLVIADPDANAIIRIASETGPQTIAHSGLPILFVTGLDLFDLQVAVPGLTHSGLWILAALTLLTAASRLTARP